MKPSAQAVSFSAVLAAVSAATAALLLAGCGSGGSSAPVSGTPLGASGSGSTTATTNRAKGTISFTVKWPAPTTTRLIPAASQSIKVTLTPLDATGAPSGDGVTQTLARPAAGQPLTVTAIFQGLLPGSYIALAQAFPTATATGTAQASGPADTATGSTALPVFVKGGVNPALTITMGTTITGFTLTPQNGPSLRATDTRVFTAVATDADGANVIIGPSITFKLNTPGPFNLAVNGTTATLTYTGGMLTSNQTASVTATDSESGLSSTATATFVVAGPVNPAVTWGKFHANAQNTGQAARTPGFVNAAGTTIPGFPNATNAQIEFSSPAIGTDGTIYVGANDNNLYAFTPSGTTKWKFQTGGFVESSPSIGLDGTIYFGSLDGTVYAVRDSGSSATVVWTQAADGPVFGSPTIDNNGFLYIGSTTPGHTLYKMDALSGAIIWQYAEPTDGIQDAPALNLTQSLVYVGSLDNNVYAVDTASGLRRWKSATTGPIYSSSPAVATVNGVETVYIGSLDGILYALDANGGGPIYSYNAGSSIYSSPAVAANPGLNGAVVVYFATFDSAGGTGNTVYGISAAPTTTGSRQPQAVYFGRTFTQGFTSSPAISPDGTRLYLGCYDGNVYGLNTVNGNSIFTFSTPAVPVGTLPEQFDSSPAIAPNGNIFVGGFSGNLYGIR